ncbi:alternative NAD(P)H-ubiquinone oxidoreductase C1, chloroplastic/mitochondrial [Heracleum sosnowskyi]|uniref:demethylphylloquinone reductase n=1 Tax=Heracleum sosnowskyi TaxID=360622 RepID=A0AAD8JID0_9APIA|nr:alternative NAD(P)H-ubiquinone oxidoreductase C1, chloroplastic/mitochondrial [Heracleum sosnowskyi]
MAAAFTAPFSPSPPFASFNRERTTRISFLPCSSAKFALSPLFFEKYGRNKLPIVSCNAMSKNGDNVEISQEEEAPRKFVWRDDKKPRVCILGGGFGGLYTALRLESLEWPDDKKPQVLLIDQSERFVFKPMLYELLSGEVDSWEIAPRFSDLLANTGVQFFQDRVKLLHPSDNLRMGAPTRSSYGGTVHLESGITIEYDWLVLALGADSKRDVVPGAAEFAIPFSTLEDAWKVNEKLKILERKTFGTNTPVCVAVVGCGYSGVELAATIAERLQNRGIVKAINVGNEIIPDAPPGNRQAAQKVLSSRKVQLLQGYFVSCIRQGEDNRSSGKQTDMRDIGNTPGAYDPDKLLLELQPTEKGQQSQLLEADLVLWTVGSRSLLPQLEPCEPYELPLNGRGQVETEETLRVKGHPRIFAVGDSSATKDSKGKLLPPTAQVAFQQADFAGWNLWAAINDRPLLPFRYQNLGEMMVLGRNDAALSPTFIEGLTFEGPIGHAARKLAYLYRLPTDEHRLKVGISWLTKSAVESVALLQDAVTKVLQGS